MKGMARKRFLWIVGAILMLVYIYWGRHDLGRIVELDPFMVGVCFLCTLGIGISSATKWKISLDCIGETGATHFGTLFHYFMMGRTVGLVMPMDVSDFGVRTMSLKFGHSVSIGRASYSVYLDRTFDVVIAGLFLVPSILFITGAVETRTALTVFGITFAGGLFCFTFLAYESMAVLDFVFKSLFKVICRIPGLRKRVSFETEARLLEIKGLKKIAPSLFLLSGIKFLFTAMRFVSIAAAMGVSLSAWEIVLFVPGAQFAALFALTPGGLGIADWSWSGLLYKLGAAKNEIVPYMISLRLVTALSIVVIAGFSRLLYRRPVKQEEGQE
jgi:uncharacterized protein (TIRG00374 family)